MRLHAAWFGLKNPRPSCAHGTLRMKCKVCAPPGTPADCVLALVCEHRVADRVVWCSSAASDTVSTIVSRAVARCSPPPHRGCRRCCCARVRARTYIGIARLVQECGGSQICQHNRQKSFCKVLPPLNRGCRRCSARACVRGLMLELRVWCRSAAARRSVSTIVSRASAR